MTTDAAVTSLAQTEDTTFTYDELRETTTELVDPPSSWAGSSVIEPFLIGVCLFGFIANSAMLTCLLVYRQTNRKTMNIFIFNQTVLDLVTTLLVSVKMALVMSGYFKTKKTGVLRMLMCMLIESDAITASVLYSAIYGLVVITVERYVKIVHPVAHRNHYRRWMTYVGVATPWLIGFITSAVPSLTTAHFIDGTCRKHVYPTRAGLCAARVAIFSWRFVIPLVVFVICYWKIIMALRRSAKVGVSHSEQQTAGQSTSAAAATGQSKPLNKSQKNVIKTMIVVISCFIVCWTPIQFQIVGSLCGLQSFRSLTLYNALAVIAFVNPCANPFIYATGIYPFFTEKFVAGLRRLVRGENQVSPVELVEQRIGTTRRNNSNDIEANSSV